MTSKVFFEPHLREPKTRLYKSTKELIKVSSQKLKLVEKAFEDNPEVYTNISDQIAQICMASIIVQLNKIDFNDCLYVDFLSIGSFKMSTETSDQNYKNLQIIKKNKRIEEQNRTGIFSHHSSPSSSSGCYIATMVYGDYNHPQVLLLRNFRDSFLAHYVLGRSFIRLYYKYSPSWVEALKNKTIVNKVIKRGLTIFIKLIK